MPSFPHLFSPFELKGLEIKNRIFSTGHDTYLPENGLPTEPYIAYQRARAIGGVGLIVVQVVGVHESARYTDQLLMGTSDDCIPHFRRLVDAIHAHGVMVIVQLFHPGREVLGRPEGVAQAAYAPSFSPSERFRTVPRTLTAEEIGSIVSGFGSTARRMAEAGADGVEIVASHGYLPAQFMNPNVNRRQDRYGGSLENRVRFVAEAATAIRREVPADFVVGMRFSGDELDEAGLKEDETLKIARALAPRLDYLNVIAGTSFSTGGATHIVPSMFTANAYLAPFAAQVKQATGKPVFVAGRINQPHDAERIIAGGGADLVGMTRALICDPRMPAKARQGRADDIRACIACNQACIGHFQLGLPISCIQHPETGRELEFDAVRRTKQPKRVMVIGGGVGGMKAAASAAERGHDVSLYERSPRLGGQALVAQLLPGRAEFGGIVTNLAREVEQAGASIHAGITVTPAHIAAARPDQVILATGSGLASPIFEGREDATNVVHAVDVIAGRARTGKRVVIYDWLADWVGAGTAEKLASEGAHVRLAVNGLAAAANIQNYVRDVYVGKLHKLGVEVVAYMRLYGIDGSTVYFLHTASQQPVVLEDVDTLVLACPNAPEDGLAADIRGLAIPVTLIGDCLAPRTAEEAVYEGLKAAAALT